MLQAHESAITCMRYTHNENWLMTSDGLGRIKYWKGRNELVKASLLDLCSRFMEDLNLARREYLVYPMSSCI